ncbi:MAG: OadG family protein [Cellvibrionaceae bacterium]|nr:OadG family protein [Cellvibrionaceae bacterium]MCV6626411.1 OadG family protein [Cellvibrionaceae bacterium]
MSASIMQQGTDLMLFGMGTVFVFLTLLVIAVTIMSALIQKYFPEAPEPDVSPGHAPPANTVQDPKVIAIIKAALDQHRNK